MKKKNITCIIYFLTVQGLFAAEANESGAQAKFDENSTFQLQQLAENTDEFSWGTDRAEVARLIRKRADPNTVRKIDRRSFLHLAAQNNEIDLAQKLLVHKANVDIESTDGKTPLFEAYTVGMIQLLVGHKANVRHCLRDGGNLLHKAALNERVDQHILAECFAQFCMLGVDPRGIDNHGDTPLHVLFEMSSMYVDEDIAKKASALLLVGADLYSKNQKGRMPLELLANHRPNLVASVITFNNLLKQKSQVEKESLLRELNTGNKSVGIKLDNFGPRLKRRCVIL